MSVDLEFLRISKHRISVVHAIFHIVSASRKVHSNHKYHFVKESTEHGIIEPRDVASEDKLADVFSNPLMKTKFEKFKDIILP